ncbi:hypothetical protein EDD86DRAFT_113154 [Gorgonomyces haynaldii]|nr:hypothetical protein EDD86DRAFT_113154 [Gorgonomyces haynaldii]
MLFSFLLMDHVKQKVAEIMKRYDASHDLEHVKRVVSLGHIIYDQEPHGDRETVELACWLHDVNDHKYPSDVKARDILLAAGYQEQLIQRVELIVDNTSFSKEQQMDPQKMQDLLQTIPELRIVIDADRLDAIGAVGIGRTFCFGGSRQVTLLDVLQHFDDKLLDLHKTFKTRIGSQLALERTERLRKFKDWMTHEMDFARLSL